MNYPRLCRTGMGLWIFWKKLVYLQDHCQATVKETVGAFWSWKEHEATCRECEKERNANSQRNAKRS
jgi:hypothetical protein